MFRWINWICFLHHSYSNSFTNFCRKECQKKLLCQIKSLGLEWNVHMRMGFVSFLFLIFLVAKFSHLIFYFFLFSRYKTKMNTKVFSKAHYLFNMWNTPRGKYVLFMFSSFIVRVLLSIFKLFICLFERSSTVEVVEKQHYFQTL